MLVYSTVLLLLALPFSSANDCIKYSCSACACYEWENPSPTVTAEPSPTPTGPANLIINGGWEWFDGGGIAPWISKQGTGGSRPWNNDDEPYMTPYVPYHSRSGKWLLIMANPTDWQGNVIAETMSQTVSLVSGTEYRFEAYYTLLFLPKTTTTCRLWASIDGVEKGEVTVGNSDLGDPYNFDLITFPYTPSTTGDSTVSIQFMCNDATYEDGGMVGVDDISLTEVTTA
ncbi:unnamed protein product [Clonostachys chloroleuca]|uniref:CBM-cenC domain-containing protein n=1 Tax=Clonostachys chloroleuca TaxID=1926264 RepID=A0AA35QBJ5_9HYPO|nr:unnamed protein product [Clonostachys chloroleuca]